MRSQASDGSATRIGRFDPPSVTSASAVTRRRGRQGGGVSRSERWSRRGSNVVDHPTWFLLEADILNSYSAEAIPEYRNVALCRRKKTGRSCIALSVSTICVWDEGRIFLLGLPRGSGRCGGRPGGRAWCQSLPVLSVSTGGTGRAVRNGGEGARTFCV